jgi:hypothetical protein
LLTEKDEEKQKELRSLVDERLKNSEDGLSSAYL